MDSRNLLGLNRKLFYSERGTEVFKISSKAQLEVENNINLLELLSNKMPGKKRKSKYRLCFGWYGGKFSHLEWLLPLLPNCSHFCEPYAGSASVLINRKPSPVETYNDIDGEVVNFFRALREQGRELIEAIMLTPFSREEFELAINGVKENVSNLELARRFYIKARQVRTGLAQTASLGRWANCLNTSRRGMSGAVSRWLGGAEDLSEIAVRLLRVQIENDNAINVIKRYDSPNTLFYCDPPYPHETRGDSKAYGYEMTTNEHVELAKVLNNVSGMVAISGYRCDLMDSLYRGWRCVESEKTCHSVKQIRVEALWMNY